MKNKFAETLASLNVILKNGWFGMIIPLDPYSIGTTDEYPIQYMRENRCNGYNQDLGYPTWQVKKAWERIIALAENAFADGKWLQACALQIAYVAELNTYFVLDGNSRLAAILYLNQVRMEQGLEPLFTEIPAQLTPYETYSDAQRAMDLLNDACVASKNTKKAYDVQEKRRMFAINNGGEYAALYNEFVALQESYPEYVSDRAAEIVVYGNTKTAQFDNCKRSPYSHISKVIMDNVFPQTLPTKVLSSCDGKRKKMIETAYQSFTTPLVFGELAYYIYQIKPSLKANELRTIANRIKALMFSDDYFSTSLLIEVIVNNRNRVKRRDALIEMICKDKLCVDILGKRFKSQYEKMTTKRK